MFLFPIGFFYTYFMVAGKRIAAKQRKEKAVFLGMESGCAQTPASISSSRLQDRNFTQRGPWKSIEDDFMGKRRNCGVNEHLCFCTDANDTQQVTTRCIIAPFILKGFGRCCVRERHAPSLQVPARLPVDGTRFSAVPSPDRRSALPDRPESFPAFRHGCKDDAHALSGSAPTSCVQGSFPGAGKSAASALLWLFRCGGRQGQFSVGSWHRSPFSKVFIRLQTFYNSYLPPCIL